MSSNSARIPLNQPSQKIHPPVFRTGVMVGSIEVCAIAAAAGDEDGDDRSREHADDPPRRHHRAGF